MQNVFRGKKWRQKRSDLSLSTHLLVPMSCFFIPDDHHWTVNVELLQPGGPWDLGCASVAASSQLEHGLWPGELVRGWGKASNEVGGGLCGAREKSTPQRIRCLDVGLFFSIGDVVNPIPSTTYIYIYIYNYIYRLSTPLGPDVFCVKDIMFFLSHWGWWFIVGFFVPHVWNQ